MNRLFYIDTDITINILDQLYAKDIGRASSACKAWYAGIHSDLINSSKGSLLAQFIESFQLLLTVYDQKSAENFEKCVHFKHRISKSGSKIFKFSMQVNNQYHPVSVFFCMEKIRELSRSYFTHINSEALNYPDCQQLLVNSFGAHFYHSLVPKPQLANKVMPMSPSDSKDEVIEDFKFAEPNDIAEIDKQLALSGIPLETILIDTGVDHPEQWEFLKLVDSLIRENDLHMVLAVMESTSSDDYLKIAVIRRLLRSQHIEEGLELINRLSNKRHEGLLDCVTDFNAIGQIVVDQWFIKGDQQIKVGEKQVNLLVNLLEAIPIPINLPLFTSFLYKIKERGTLVFGKWIQDKLERNEKDKALEIIDLIHKQTDLPLSYVSVAAAGLMRLWVKNKEFEKYLEFIMTYQLKSRSQRWLHYAIAGEGFFFAERKINNLPPGPIKDQLQYDLGRLKAQIPEWRFYGSFDKKDDIQNI